MCALWSLELGLSIGPSAPPDGLQAACRPPGEGPQHSPHRNQPSAHSAGQCSEGLPAEVSGHCSILRTVTFAQNSHDTCVQFLFISVLHIGVSGSLLSIYIYIYLPHPSIYYLSLSIYPSIHLYLSQLTTCN